MKRGFLGRFGCVALSLVLPVGSVFADSNSAMLHTSGAVTINGTVTSNSSAIFAGDNVKTDSNSSGVISTTGAVINVLPNSDVKFKGNQLDVNGGAVEVSTSSGLSVLANSFTISPQGTAKFQINRTGFCGSVSVLQGSVVVTNGKKRTVLEQGKSIAIDDAKCGALAAISPAGPTANGGIMSSTTAGIIAGGAAAGVSSYVIITHKPPKMSPDTTH